VKYILVTGASSGIGYDACRFLLEKGYSVMGTVRTPEDKLRLETAFGQAFSAYIADLESVESVDRLVAALQENLKKTGLYGLVNNAGLALGGPLIHLSEAELKKQLNINFFSVFRLTNALANLLGAGYNSPYEPGRIVNISSVSGLINTPLLGPYCISKHALESLSDIYRRELLMFGVRVVLIEPGPISTPIWKKSIPRENPVKGTDYEDIYPIFYHNVLKSEQNALPVEEVSRRIHDALSRKNPANRYLIAKNKTAIWLLARLFPSRWLDKIFLRQLKNRQVPKP
jgi:NAD(P)-dependent dehydrogenase (short-subunit alcohol dehydrogenase family)